MKVIDFGQTNSILNQYISEIRNVEVQNDRLRFRRNIERIGEIMAYEMSKEFKYSVKNIQTPLGIAPVSTPDNNLVSVRSCVLVCLSIKVSLAISTGRRMRLFPLTANIKIR